MAVNGAHARTGAAGAFSTQPNVGSTGNLLNRHPAAAVAPLPSASTQLRTTARAALRPSAPVRAPLVLCVAKRRAPGRGPAPVKATPEDLVKNSVGSPVRMQYVQEPEDLDQLIEEVDDTAPEEPEYKLKYLYDGACSVCMGLVNMLKSRKGHEDIYFVDISSNTYSPRRHQGITYDVAMDTMHVIRPGGEILQGMEALRSLYKQVGLGWVFRLAQLPLLSKAAEIIFKLVSKNRVALSGGMDAVMAVGRINMEKEGTGTCEADGDCRAEPEPQSPEPGASESGEEGDTPQVFGSWIDHENVLGIYTYGKGEGLRAAPIDATTGRMLAPGKAVKLKSHDFEELITAIDTLITAFNWEGVIGLGLPGMLSRRDQLANEWVPPEMQASLKTMSPRRSRLEFQEELKNACNHDVIVLSGAECNGYGEIGYGVGQSLEGLVLMVTMGSRIGAALYDNGALVRNISGIVTDLLESWDDPKWEDSQLPDGAMVNDEERWTAWATRCHEHLLKLERFCNPDHIIIGGSATRGQGFERLLPLLPEVKAPLHKAKLGHLAGVKGAAAAASFELGFRGGLAEVRAAIGRYWSMSPSNMKEADIRKAFDKLDNNGDGFLDPREVAAAMQMMGVDLPTLEIKDLLYEMNTSGTGLVTFDEFQGFWESIATSRPVTLIHSMAEYKNLLDEESNSNRLCVLQVGFTYCKPCRAFEPKFHDMAETFGDARFFRLNGNENKEMVTIGRDILKVKRSPSFYLFRNGEEIFSWTGANEIKFEDAILRHLLPHEAGFVSNYEPKSEEDFKKPAPEPEPVAT